MKKCVLLLTLLTLGNDLLATFESPSFHRRRGGCGVAIGDLEDIWWQGLYETAVKGDLKSVNFFVSQGAFTDVNLNDVENLLKVVREKRESLSVYDNNNDQFLAAYKDIVELLVSHIDFLQNSMN
ncbi:hypothetical protein K2W90_05120 [Candidatus Babeliales bacterium]|nr:hypothetical protein [Candidatus Babeliales bacterium]